MSFQIAIIDDSSPFCLLVKQIMATSQISTDIYNSAEAFLGQIKYKKYDLIIMDINLPDLDGLTALKYLKSNVNTMSTPVLLISGDARAANVKKGIELGACDFVGKPIDPEQLLNRVVSLLRVNRDEPPAVK